MQKVGPARTRSPRPARRAAMLPSTTRFRTTGADAGVVHRHARNATQPRGTNPARSMRRGRIVHDEHVSAVEQIGRSMQQPESERPRRGLRGSAAPYRHDGLLADGPGERAGAQQVTEPDSWSRRDAKRAPQPCRVDAHANRLRIASMTWSTASSAMPADSGSDNVRSAICSADGHRPRRQPNCC